MRAQRRDAALLGQALLRIKSQAGAPRVTARSILSQKKRSRPACNDCSAAAAMHNRRMADQQNTLGDTPALAEPPPLDQPEQIAALAVDLLGHMHAALERAAEDPFSNPVMTVALSISRRIDQGTLTDVELTGLVCWLRDEAYQARAGRIADYVGLTSGGLTSGGLASGIEPEAAMAELARHLVRPDPNDSAIPFAQFRRGADPRLGGLHGASDVFPALSGRRRARPRRLGRDRHRLLHLPSPGARDARG
jgi:hypothetical protein